MIIDTLDNFRKYIKLNNYFAPAFEFLRQKNLKNYSSGRYDIKKNDVYAMVSEAKGKGREGAFFEVHKKYIDIQICLVGEDFIGCKFLSECKKRKKAYDAKKDYGLFGDKIDSGFKLTKNSFAIFFPTDAHAPLAGTGELKKVVVKVRVR